MLTTPRIITLSAIVLLLSTSAFVVPAHASTSSSQHPARHERNHPEWNRKDHAEERIKTLHDTLNVTREQETDWADVANAMRDSEAAIGNLIRSRHGNTQGNAIDDLKSYQAISQAHTDGMSQFIDAFESFYDDLTPEQKQKADAFFKNPRHHGGAHPRHKKMAQPSPASKAR